MPRAAAVVLVLALVALPAAAFHEETETIASGVGGGASWAAVALDLPAGAALRVHVRVEGERGATAMGVGFVSADGSVAWSDVLHESPYGVRLAATVREAPAPEISLGGSGASAELRGFTLLSHGGPRRGALVLWTAGEAERVAWEVAASEGARAGAVTRGESTFSFTERDFAGVAFEAALDAGASGLVAGTMGVGVSRSLFGVFAIENRDGGCVSDARLATTACAWPTLARASWEGPDAAGTIAGESVHETFAGTAPGAYAFRVDALVDAGLNAYTCPFYGEVSSCAVSTTARVLLAGADVSLPHS